MIFYAAPHDVNENLGYLYERLGDRRVAVIKEISKILKTNENTVKTRLARAREQLKNIIKGGIEDE